MAANMAYEGGWRSQGWRALVWGTAAALLVLPAVAMRFTAEVDWNAFDFLVMGAVLLACCVAFEIARWAARSHAYLFAACLAIGTGFLTIWINLAVGIVGDEGNPANAMFFGVLLVGIIGVLLARLRPRGMVVALVATSIAQVVVGITAFATAANYLPAIGISAVFAVAYLASAALFARAAKIEPGR
jgi:hypothetical protein